jgi:hypothetical protein
LELYILKIMLRNLKYLILMVVGIFLLDGCIEQIEFPIEASERKVVIDGTFSDLEEFQEIKISWSVEVNKQIFDPYSGAIVQVEEEGGDKILFQESQPGVYTAFAKADPQKKYRVLIQLLDGSIITSRFQSAPKSFPVTEVTVQDTVSNFLNESGQRVRVRSLECNARSQATTIEEQLFLRYDLETVWQLTEVQCGPFHTVKSCYIYESDLAFDIEMLRLEPQNEPIDFTTFVFRKPIDRSFGEVFSIKVDLLSYNKQEFRYWETIQSIFEQSGNITDVLPARLPQDLQVNGNAEVFGTFAVVGKSSYVRFIRNADFPTHVNPFCGAAGFVTFPFPPECCSCLNHPGASVVKPRYW